MADSLEGLYQLHILDHSKLRKGYGNAEHPSAERFERNPTCGDELTMQLVLEPNSDRIAALAEGRTVITKKAWDALPEAQRPAMLKAAAEAGVQIKQKSRQESDEAVEAMKKRGLKVQSLSPELLTVWQNFAAEVYPHIRGTVVSADMFDEVQKLVKEYRERKP